MKKSISFILAAFLILLGVALSRDASAQGKAHMQYTWSHYGYSKVLIPLFCDGEIVEVVMRLEYHCVCHWIYDEDLGRWDELYMIMRWRGDFDYEGEVFNVDFYTQQSKHDDYVRRDPEYWQNVDFVTHVLGSNGTNLIVTGTVDMLQPTAADWVITYDKTIIN